MQSKASGITPRAVLIGLLFTALLGVVTPYCDLVLQGTWIACCHLPIGVFILFTILLLGVNTPLYQFGTKLGFTPQELLTIYAMMLVGAGIPSFGLTEYLFPTLAGAYYFSSPENKWVEECFKHIPQWMVPYNVEEAMTAAGATTAGALSFDALYSHLPAWMLPGNRSVVTAFYEGLKPGQHIPWGAWAVPIFAWTFAALVLFFCMTCVSTILRKHWIEHDRLVFPLAQLPLEMVRDQSAESPVPSFFRNRLMWMGCSIPAVVHSINGLHFYYPAIPEIKLAYALNQYFTGPLWKQMGIFMVILHFSIVGFSYLLTSELSFSLWFFFFFYIFESVILTYLGVQLQPLPGYPTQPHAALQMIGAFVMVAAWMLWSARFHIWDVLRKALTGTEEVDDTEEPMSFRLAVFGLAAGLLILCLWCRAAGMPVYLAVAAFVLFFMFALMLTRLVSESGLLFVQAFRPTDVMIQWMGSSFLGARNLLLFGFIEKAFMFDLRTFLMPSLMDSHRIAESSGIRPRKLLPWLCLSIITAVVSSYIAFLTMAYRHGGVKLMSWFLTISPQQTFSFATSYMHTPYETTAMSRGLIVFGALMTWFISFMRARYLWWPLHPLGYAMGPSWPMIQLWFSIMVGWLLKTVILRYWGLRTFRRAKPFFLGLVVGEFGIAGVWLLIDFLCHKTGHRFFLS
ncbi:MAG: hypothetical protein HY318_11895 [Armatimonadetes bacterium]|nr:hypothetical protein [Armatimonadota bacterium]